MEWVSLVIGCSHYVCSHFAYFIASMLVFLKARSLRSLTSNDNENDDEGVAVNGIAIAWTTTSLGALLLVVPAAHGLLCSGCCAEAGELDEVAVLGRFGELSWIRAKVALWAELGGGRVLQTELPEDALALKRETTVDNFTMAIVDQTLGICVIEVRDNDAVDRVAEVTSWRGGGGG